MARAALLTFLITLACGAYATKRTMGDNEVYLVARDCLEVEKASYASWWEENIGAEFDPEELQEVTVDRYKNFVRAHFDTGLDKHGRRAIFHVILDHDAETGAYTWRGIVCTGRAFSRQPMEQLDAPIRFTPSRLAP